MKSITAPALILLLLLSANAAVSASVCPDPNDPGCCLQTVDITNANGSISSVPLGYNPTNGTCVWPAGYSGSSATSPVDTAPDSTSTTTTAGSDIPMNSTATTDIASAMNTATPSSTTTTDTTTDTTSANVPVTNTETPMTPITAISSGISKVAGCGLLFMFPLLFQLF